MSEHDEIQLQRLGVGVVVGTGLGAALIPVLGPAALAIGAGMGTAIGAAMADHATRDHGDRSHD